MVGTPTCTQEVVHHILDYGVETTEEVFSFHHSLHEKKNETNSMELNSSWEDKGC
jgi:hypothetical protein